MARALGDCFVSPHLPTGIASSPALLAKTVGVGRDCFAEFTLSQRFFAALRMIKGEGLPQDDRKRRARNDSGALASPISVQIYLNQIKVGLLPIDYSLCHNLDLSCYQRFWR